MSPEEGAPTASGRFLAAGQRHLIGIYGGVGPLSHTLFEQHLLASSHRRGARADQEHPVWLLVSASSTPNRMESIAGTGESAEPHIRHFAHLLERAGADVLFVVCNTAHAYHEAVQPGLGIPWVHLMDLTAGHIRRALPEVARVGILGTDGTLATRLYHRALASHGLDPVAPDVGAEPQRLIMEAIFDTSWGIKATGAAVSERARANLVRAADWCVDRGAQAVIAACTEVSVALTAEAFPRVPVVDPLLVAADVAIDLAFGRRDPAEFMGGPAGPDRPR
jgi:aspartate racemase